VIEAVAEDVGVPELVSLGLADDVSVCEPVAVALELGVLLAVDVVVGVCVDVEVPDSVCRRGRGRVRAVLQRAEGLSGSLRSDIVAKANALRAAHSLHSRSTRPWATMTVSGTQYLWRCCSRSRWR